MKTQFGGHTVILDRSGAAVLVEEKVIVVGNVHYDSSQAELFPEVSTQSAVEDSISELVGKHAPTAVVILNQDRTADEPALRDFINSLNTDAVFIGQGELDSISYGDLTVGGEKYEAPAIRVGDLPDQEGDSCFVLNSGCLTLPEFGPRPVHPPFSETGLVVLSALA